MTQCLPLNAQSAGWFSLVLVVLVLQQITNTSNLIPHHDIDVQDLCISSPIGNHTSKTVNVNIAKSHPQFVFLVGTEGSGHHLWSSLIKKSPNLATLRKLDLLAAAENITYQLFEKRDLEHSLFAGAACHEGWNGSLLVEQTARKLSVVASKLPSDVTVPLNGIPNTKPRSGMMSYPNFRSKEKCAAFRYPDLSLLQQACKVAQVSCHFIVQYRDPLSVLRSTAQRRNMHSMGYAIPLYTSILNTIRFQMIHQMSHDASLEFCWDYRENNPPGRLGVLLGWNDQDEFSKIFREEYQPSSARSMEEVVSEQHRALLPSLLAAHEEVKTACKNL